MKKKPTKKGKKVDFIKVTPKFSKGTTFNVSVKVTGIPKYRCVDCGTGVEQHEAQCSSCRMEI